MEGTRSFTAPWYEEDCLWSIKYSFARGLMESYNMYKQAKAYADLMA